MGKLPHSARRKKGVGKRWKRGQSSSSNPQHNKHRTTAKGSFFNVTVGSSNLTVDALAQHDSHQNENIEVDNADHQDAGHQDAKTFNTWATNWTECTNDAFAKVHRYCSSNSAVHKEVLAILAAVTEVIKTQGGVESETEYFAALMTATESVATDESLSAVVYLLSLVMKKMPIVPLKAKFSDIASRFYDLLVKYSESNHCSLLKSLFKCLAKVIQVQDLAVWHESSTLRIYRGLLSFVVHAKPRIRKTAQRAIVAVLKGDLVREQIGTSWHPAAEITASFCVELMKDESCTTTLHVLGFLKLVFDTFPKKSTKMVCETILRLLTLSNIYITTQAMQAFHGLFSHRPQASCLSAELNVQVIKALYDLQPEESDIQPTNAWLSVMKEGYFNLAKLDTTLVVGHLPRFYQSCMSCLRSNNVNISDTVTTVMREILQQCIKPAVENSTTIDDSIVRVFRSIEGGLSYQFYGSWDKIIDVVSEAFRCLGKKYHKIMHKCLSSMADLRDSHQFSYKGEVDGAIGVAIATLGPDIVLQAIPLQIQADDTDGVFPRSWLLPVMKDNVQDTKLGFFVSYFLPLAAKCRSRSIVLANQKRNTESIAYQTIHRQIWTLLNAFCTRPTDIKESFAGVAKVLGTALNNNVDLHMIVLTSLCKLVVHSANDLHNQAEMARFSKNYLPILFNMFTLEPTNPKVNNPVRVATLDLIRSYISITDVELVLSFCDKCIERFEEVDSTAFRKHAMMDILVAMVLYIDKDRLRKVHDVFTPLLLSSDRTVQKKSYRIFEEICAAKSGTCKEFVEENLYLLQQSLLNSLSTSSSPAKAPRLRCLISIVKHLSSPRPDFLTAIVPEAVLCTKEIAEKARLAAYSLLVEMAEASIRWSEKSRSEAVDEYLQGIIVGLVGSVQMIPRTILALARLLFEYKLDISDLVLDQLMDNICILMKSRTREIVVSALSFLKMVIGLFTESKLSRYLMKLVSALVYMKDENRHHFRFKAKEIFQRLIRKFGFKTINDMAPVSHSAMLANINKTEKRQKRKKLEHTSDKTKSTDGGKSPSFAKSIEELLFDSESEHEDDAKPEKNKTKKPGATWLKEGGTEIIDFMDKSVSKQVTTTQPEAEVKQTVKHKFKKAPDGRLLISDKTDDNDALKPDKRPEPDIDDIDELIEAMSGPRKKRKKTMNHLNNDDDDFEPPSNTRSLGIRRHELQANKSKTSNVSKSVKSDSDKKTGKKLDPYAYVPLDFNNLSKRKRAKATGLFNSFVKAAKKGAIVRGKKGAAVRGKKKPKK